MTITDPTSAATPERPDRSRRAGPTSRAVPHSPVRAAVARRLFRHAAARLPIRVLEAGRPPYGGGGPESPTMRLVRPEAFFHRVGATGTIGFGEAYMAGDWTADDLAGVLTAFAAHIRELVPAALQKLRHAVLRRQPETDDNTITGARANISRHYDLSNDLFALFLDESLTYSSALFDGDPLDSAGDRTSRRAQRRKIDRLLDVAQVRAGSRLLEIGSGWGELAIRAAKRGATRHHDHAVRGAGGLARDRIAAEGLTDRATVVLQDYRQTQGKYDAVVSVEMIEAVGFNHWPDYFGTVDERLVPGGRFGLQAITQDDDAVQASRDTYTWTRKYIFPGGQLPSVESIARTVREHTSLRVTDRYMFGGHYAETLRRWRERFEARAEQVTCARLRRRPSAACGRCTSPTPRPAFAPATSTSASSPWPSRRDAPPRQRSPAQPVEAQPGERERRRKEDAGLVPLERPVPVGRLVGHDAVIGRAQLGDAGLQRIATAGDRDARAVAPSTGGRHRPAGPGRGRRARRSGPSERLAARVDERGSNRSTRWAGWIGAGEQRCRHRRCCCRSRARPRRAGSIRCRGEIRCGRTQVGERRAGRRGTRRGWPPSPAACAGSAARTATPSANPNAA